MFLHFRERVLLWIQIQFDELRIRLRAQFISNWSNRSKYCLSHIHIWVIHTWVIKLYDYFNARFVVVCSRTSTIVEYEKQSFFKLEILELTRVIQTFELKYSCKKVLEQKKMPKLILITMKFIVWIEWNHIFVQRLLT